MGVLSRLLLLAVAGVSMLLAAMTAFPTEPFTSAVRSLGCEGRVSWEASDDGPGTVLAVEVAQCPLSVGPEMVAEAVWTVSPFTVDFVSATVLRGDGPSQAVPSAAQLTAVTGVEHRDLPRPEGRIGPGAVVGELAARTIPFLAVGMAFCALAGGVRLVRRGVIQPAIMTGAQR